MSGAFAVEPSKAIGSTSVSIRVANGSLDYENPNHQKFIMLVSKCYYEIITKCFISLLSIIIIPMYF